MTIIVQVTHPAHVHFFKHVIRELRQDGYDVRVLALEKEITIDLLEKFDIEYELACSRPNYDVGHIRTQARLTWATYKAVKETNAEVITSIGGTSAAHVSAVSDARSVVFYDTEHATLQNSITYPFADVICTPECYQGEIGSNQVRYPGYQELAYLHPNRFDPDPSVLDDADLGRGEQFVILRLVSWDAMHDVGDSGFEDIVDVVEGLENTGATVRITSEADLPSTIENRKVPIPPHRIHDLMAYADLYIGESATMATESAVLGTPAIFVSSSRRGYTDELEEEYGLVFNYSEQNRHEEGLNKAIDILEEGDGKQWECRKDDLLEDKIDTSNFIISRICDQRDFA